MRLQSILQDLNNLKNNGSNVTILQKELIQKTVNVANEITNKINILVLTKLPISNIYRYYLPLNYTIRLKHGVRNGKLEFNTGCSHISFTEDISIDQCIQFINDIKNNNLLNKIKKYISTCDDDELNELNNLDDTIFGLY